MKAKGRLVITRDPGGKDQGTMLFTDQERTWNRWFKDARLTSRTRARLRIRARVTEEGALYCLVYPQGYSHPGKITFLLYLPKEYGTVSVTGKDPANHKRFTNWSCTFTTRGLVG